MLKTLWRRDRDSNPGYAHTHAGFQDRCLKPTRPSLLGTIVIISMDKYYVNTFIKIFLNNLFAFNKLLDRLLK